MTTDLISELLTTNPELTIYEFNQIIHGEKKDCRPYFVHTVQSPDNVSFRNDEYNRRKSVPVRKVVRPRKEKELYQVRTKDIRIPAVITIPAFTRPAAEYSNRQW